jgi:ubiquinone/menaquinone biosynthesis C-methylase UbiE
MQSVSLELGCGSTKRVPEAIGIDALDHACVDIVGDVFDVLSKVPEGCVDSIHSYHFLEHVADLRLLMNEMGRVLRVGGRLEAVVPHFSNPYYYSDYTHQRPFGIYSFSYFCRENIFSRRTPNYDNLMLLQLDSARLVFKSSRPFYGRHAFKKCFEIMVNATSYTKELYEEFLCFVMPCYEICFMATRIDKSERN